MGFRHAWTRLSCPNNSILFFELESLYTTIIPETVCLFNNIHIYIYSPSFMNFFFFFFFWRNSPREKIFCALAFDPKREKETVRFVEHRPCMLLLHVVNHFFPERKMSVSLKTPQIV